MYETYFMNFAKCKENTTIDFFGENSTATTQAIKFCNDCVVKKACLEYSVTNQIEHGVWGGMSQRARRALIDRHYGFVRRSFRTKAIKYNAS